MGPELQNEWNRGIMIAPEESIRPSIASTRIGFVNQIIRQSECCIYETNVSSIQQDVPSESRSALEGEQIVTDR